MAAVQDGPVATGTTAVVDGGTCSRPKEAKHSEDQSLVSSAAVATEPGCLICMTAEASDATAVKACGHIFCYVCIHQWGATRRAPTCPVCRAALTTLVLSDGREQEVVPATAAARDEGPDLSCLDHAYFLGEVSRLVSRAESVRSRFYRDNMNCGRRGTAESERSMSGLSEVLARLESYRIGLGGDHPAPFEAEPLLHDLYQLDRMVTSLSTGSSEGLEDLQSYQGRVAYDECCSDDFYDDEEDGWPEEEDEFDARSLGRAASGLRSGSISRTPGRRPPHRASSNRSGGPGGAGAGGGGGSSGVGGSGGSSTRGGQRRSAR